MAPDEGLVLLCGWCGQPAEMSQARYDPVLSCSLGCRWALHSQCRLALLDVLDGADFYMFVVDEVCVCRFIDLLRGSADMNQTVPDYN